MQRAPHLEHLEPLALPAVRRLVLLLRLAEREVARKEVARGKRLRARNLPAHALDAAERRVGHKARPDHGAVPGGGVVEGGQDGRLGAPRGGVVREDGKHVARHAGGRGRGAAVAVAVEADVCVVHDGGAPGHGARAVLGVLPRHALRRLVHGEGGVKGGGREDAALVLAREVELLEAAKGGIERVDDGVVALRLRALR